MDAVNKGPLSSSVDASVSVLHHGPSSVPSQRRISDGISSPPPKIVEPSDREGDELRKKLERQQSKIDEAERRRKAKEDREASGVICRPSAVEDSDNNRKRTTRNSNLGDEDLGRS